jgi:hypothetical protein
MPWIRMKVWSPVNVYVLSNAQMKNIFIFFILIVNIYSEKGIWFANKLALSRMLSDVFHSICKAILKS